MPDQPDPDTVEIQLPGLVDTYLLDAGPGYYRDARGPARRLGRGVSVRVALTARQWVDVRRHLLDRRDALAALSAAESADGRNRLRAVDVALDRIRDALRELPGDRFNEGPPPDLGLTPC